MAQFPGDIRYAEITPSGRIPAVEARMPATGGLEAIGGALFELGQKINAQESAVELSQRKRQIEEKGYAVFNSLTADPEANEKAWTKYEQEVSGIIGQSKRGNVQRALQIEVNNQIPQWREAFDKRGLVIRKQNATDQFKFEYTTLLGRGDVGGAAQILETAKATGAMSEQEYQHYATNIFTDSALETANVDIRERRLQQAIENLSTLKDLSGDQLEKRDQLLRLAMQSQKGNDDIFGKTILKEMLAADVAEINPLERAAKALDMKNRVLDPNNGLSLEQARTLSNNINEWEKGEDPQTNETELNRLDNLINEYHAGRYTRSQLENLFMQKRYIEKSIGNAAFRKLNEDLDKAIKDFHGKMLSDVSAEARQQLVSFSDDAGWERFMAMLSDKDRKTESNKRQTEFWHASMYAREMRDWLTKNPDATEDQVYIKRTALMRGFRKRTLTEIEKLREEEERQISEIPEGLETIWNQLSDTGKQKAKEAIVAGKRPEDIVKVYYAR